MSKAILNTSIDADVLSDFRECCKEAGFTMNVVLEMFMRQFIDGGFYLKIGKNKVSVDTDE